MLNFSLRRASWLLSLYAIVYGVTMTMLGGAKDGNLYSPAPYHRLQSNALLNGHLYLGDSIRQMGHDLAWYDGHVNHVWGLGVGLWLTPFEAVWRLVVGQTYFPDRIALGVAFVLLGWFAGHTGLLLGRSFRSWAIGAAFVLLIVCCPPVWTLNFGPRIVYEETSLYACIVSLAVLTATVRVICFGRKWDFLLCAILSGLSPIMRPTHGIYGLAAMLVCSAVFLARGRSWKLLAAGNGIFAAGLGFLAATNQLRFGNPTEFGHNLTMTPGIIVYMTRLDNPMKIASAKEAGLELFGSMFLAHDVKHKWERETNELAILGQAPHERWRDPYLRTYDPLWFVGSVLGLVGTCGYIWRCRRKETSVIALLGHRKVRASACILIWSVITIGGLVLFFLRLATFSSRYLLDFGPGLTALALLAIWAWLIPRRSAVAGLVGFIALVGWLGYEIGSIKYLNHPAKLTDRANIPVTLPAANGRGLAEYRGIYDLQNKPGKTGIPYNGYGWNRPAEKDAANAHHIVILAVDKPQFIELEVSGRRHGKGGDTQPDVYRAMINSRFLPDAEVRELGDRRVVRFAVPEEVRKRNGDEILFLWFGRNYEPAERESIRDLYSVRWRN